MLILNYLYTLLLHHNTFKYIKYLNNYEMKNPFDFKLEEKSRGNKF